MELRSLNYFEQMKGRGVRVISPDKLRTVSPSAKVKDRFIIVDAVGVCVQAAKLGHHGIDAVKVPRALTRRVPSDVTGKQRPQRVHVSSLE